jgi:hypothetical protein
MEFEAYVRTTRENTGDMFPSNNHDISQLSANISKSQSGFQAVTFELTPDDVGTIDAGSLLLNFKTSTGNPAIPFEENKHYRVIIEEV